MTQVSAEERLQRIEHRATRVDERLHHVEESVVRMDERTASTKETLEYLREGFDKFRQENSNQHAQVRETLGTLMAKVEGISLKRKERISFKQWAAGFGLAVVAFVVGLITKG